MAGIIQIPMYTIKTCKYIYLSEMYMHIYEFISRFLMLGNILEYKKTTVILAYHFLKSTPLFILMIES